MIPTSIVFFVVIWLLASQITTAGNISAPLDEPLLATSLDAIHAEALVAAAHDASFNTLNLADLDISASHANSPRAIDATNPDDSCVIDIWNQLSPNAWRNALDVNPDQFIEIADDFNLAEETIIHSFKTVWFVFQCDHIFYSTEFRWDLYNKNSFAHGQPITGGPIDSHSYALSEVELSFLGYLWCRFPIWMVEMVLDPPLKLSAGDYVVAFGDVNPAPQFLMHILPEHEDPALIAAFGYWTQFNWGDILYDAAFSIVGQKTSCSSTAAIYQPTSGPSSCPTEINCLTTTNISTNISTNYKSSHID